MTESTVTEPTVTEQQVNAAAQNDWGKEFKLGDKTFEIKDLGYFDYIEFLRLAKPLVTVAASALEMNTTDGEMKVDFNPVNLDYEKIFSLCEKDLPRMAWIICRQSDAKITQTDVATLARRPQRLVEVIMLQIMHNNMIQEFGTFFQRLTGVVQAMMPDLGKIAAPSGIGTSDSTTEETPSSS